MTAEQDHDARVLCARNELEHAAAQHKIPLEVLANETRRLLGENYPFSRAVTLAANLYNEKRDRAIGIRVCDEILGLK